MRGLCTPATLPSLTASVLVVDNVYYIPLQKSDHPAHVCLLPQSHPYASSPTLAISPHNSCSTRSCVAHSHTPHPWPFTSPGSQDTDFPHNFYPVEERQGGTHCLHAPFCLPSSSLLRASLTISTLLGKQCVPVWFPVPCVFPPTPCRVLSSSLFL